MKQPINYDAISIENILRDCIIPTEVSDKILEYLISRDGYRLTKRDVDKLRQLTGDNSIAINKIAGMTNLEWNRYNKDGSYGGSFLIAYAVTDVTISSEFLREHHAIAQQENRHKYNAELHALIADKDKCQHLRAVIIHYINASNALHGMSKGFSYAYSAIAKAFGIEK